MTYYGNRSYFTTPPIVKNLLIINFIVYLAEVLLPREAAVWLVDNCSLNFWAGGNFRPWQLVSYMFLHSPNDVMHIISNMFALWMFGRVLEYDLGSRRFFVYYIITGIGAGLIQLGVNWAEYASIVSAGANAQQLYMAANASTLGASGAIFGILLAYGMMHPNNVIMLIFPPIALKAKWFVVIYGLFELFAGVTGRMGSVAHFAHLGGMLWGYLLLIWWKKKGEIYY